MKKTSRFFILLLCVLCVISVSGCATATKGFRNGKILATHSETEIVSLPSGALVKLNGKEIGKTPFKYKLPNGERSLIFDLNGKVAELVNKPKVGARGIWSLVGDALWFFVPPVAVGGLATDLISGSYKDNPALIGFDFNTSSPIGLVRFEQKSFSKSYSVIPPDLNTKSKSHDPKHLKCDCNHISTGRTK